MKRTGKLPKERHFGGYSVQCRRCGFTTFGTNLSKAKQEVKEHWEERHWKGTNEFKEQKEYNVTYFVKWQWDYLMGLKAENPKEFNRKLFSSP